MGAWNWISFEFQRLVRRRYYLRKKLLDSMDFIANQILLPHGGMLIAIFVGWFMKESLIKDEIGNTNTTLYLMWRFFVKFVAPLCVGYIFYRQFF